jgi:hypothetical protein
LNQILVPACVSVVIVHPKINLLVVVPCPDLVDIERRVSVWDLWAHTTAICLLVKHGAYTDPAGITV